MGALIALALAFAGWSASRGACADAPGSMDSSRAGESADRLEPAPLEPAHASERPTAAADVADAPEPARTAATTPEDPELESAIWVTGRVVLPPGTPPGERIEVVADGDKFPSTGTSFQRALVAADGTFRVPYAAKTRLGTLDVDAPHLWLEKEIQLSFRRGAPPPFFVVEPILGGSIEGRILVPPGAEDIATDLRGDRVDARAWSDGGTSLRRANVDHGLTFELRQLDSRLEYDVTLDPDGLLPVRHSSLTVAPGETRHIDLAPGLGARVRGRVVFPDGARPESPQVKVATRSGRDVPHRMHSLGYGDSGEHTHSGLPSWTVFEVAEDGTFDARGIPPGNLTVLAIADQSTPDSLDLGFLGDGESREGLVLELGLGGRIAGRVLWPSGAPAVGASITLFPIVDASGEAVVSSGLEPEDSFLSGIDGAFEIFGLGGGPFRVVAAAQSELDRDRPNPPFWTASADAVALDSGELDLVLREGHRVRGVVLDDRGAPVRSFRARAVPEDPRFPDLVVGERFTSPDGRFELAGVPPGARRIEVIPKIHTPPEPLSIVLPRDSGEFTFVAPRRCVLAGTVSLPDGRPAPQATITVSRENARGEKSRTSDSQGRFSIQSPAAESLLVQARLAGCVPSAIQRVAAAPGQQIHGVSLVLRRGATISGIVRATSEGESIAGRMVSTQCLGEPGIHHTQTSADGRFAFGDLPSGTYEVRLAPDAPVPAAEEPFGPRTVTIEILDGGNATVEFGSPPADVPVRGVVRAGDAPFAGALVRAHSASRPGLEPTSTSTDEQGGFELGLPAAGSYRLEVLPRGPRSLPTVRVVEVPSRGVDGIRIDLSRGVIAGTVRVATQDSSGGFDLTLERLAGARGESFAKDQSSEWPAGVFAFEFLPPGEYTLTVSAWSTEEPARDSRVSNVVRRTVSIEEGEERRDVVIELEER